MMSGTAQELAHTLLIELLAHQFAYPVRWIETQRAILNEQDVDTLLEIGPGSTLINMARQTMAQDPAIWDEVRVSSKKLLAYDKSRETIYYEMEQETEEPEHVDIPLSGGGAALDSATDHVVARSATIEDANSFPEVPDIPLSALDIIRTVCSMKVKKATPLLRAGDTIRGLAAGRSTLQNEIVGDLEREFCSMPNDVEDLPITELGSIIDQSRKGGLGEVTKLLVNRMISSKLPGNSTTSSLRNYLYRIWGLGSGLQDTVLLDCVNNQPADRIADENNSNKFIDAAVMRYASMKKVDLKRRGDNASSELGVSRIDHQQLKAVNKKQDELIRKSLELYADHLGLDIHATSEADQELQIKLREKEEVIGLWEFEHGETYTSGISAQFDPLKVREYDSAWAWELQDALELRHGSTRAISPCKIDRVRTRPIQQILESADGTALEVLEWIARNPATEYARRVFLAKLIGKRISGSQRPIGNVPIAAINPPFTSPSTSTDDRGTVIFEEITRSNILSTKQWASDIREHEYINIFTGTRIQEISGRTRLNQNHNWQINRPLTTSYFHYLIKGLSLSSRKVLLTGAGPNSIGEEILKGLLSAGAHVIAGTRSFSSSTTKRFQKLYTDYGAGTARLIVVPFNQGSRQDVEELVDYIYDTLDWDLDHILLFGAISDYDKEIDGIGSKSELALRVMLTNVIRVLGAVKKRKEARSIFCHPAQVVLPLSSNHGQFGGDGLYAESKIALEALFNKWSSESWRDYLSICGAVIGWTRGTGLMNGNDIIAAGVENLGVRTFSRKEMGFLLLALLGDEIRGASEDQPILADLDGRLSEVDSLGRVLHEIRGDIQHTSQIRKAILRDKDRDTHISVSKSVDNEPVKITPRPGIDLPFPKLPGYATEIAPIAKDLQGMVDLERVVVITGFAEVNPFGSARTRWKMETSGEYSVGDCVELALMMGLIKHFDGYIKGELYSGWIDSKSKEPIIEADIRQAYEKIIMERTGIRFVRDIDGTVPEREALQEVIIQDSMAAFELPKDVADEMKRKHGSNVEVVDLEGGESSSVRFKKGTTLLLPKSAKSRPRVAGLIPDHWDARNFGITEEIISQVDPGTLYVLVCAAETLIAAGVTDPYELYRYIHVSEFGNCVGSGLGGIQSLENMFKQRYLDKDVQKDVLQETFINTAGAWVNLLLTSSSGPLRTPVGACATSLESLETGYESIVSRKAKACLVGGYDYLHASTAQEFDNMGATVRVEEELARGRDPKEMSRPTTSSRCGFIESEGCGMQLVTSAALAIEMGLPIYGVVAFVGGASDKVGRSIPAPGKGIMTHVRETAWLRQPRILDIQYRQRLRDERLRQIQENLQFELEYAEVENSHKPNDCKYLHEVRQELIHEAEKQTRDVLNVLGNEFWKQEPQISPIRGALATWNLTVDDLDVASLHGTSTKANDQNEVAIIDEQLRKLGRLRGNPILAVCQKHLTGHPKGAAGAWMINGCLQTMDSGFVPGNANADNIDSSFRKHPNIAFLNHGLQTAGVTACSVTSFGFGQKGYQAILVHPKQLYATLDEGVYEQYRVRALQRSRKAKAYFSNAMATNSLFRAKNDAPYSVKGEQDFLVNPDAREEKKG